MDTVYHYEIGTDLGICSIDIIFIHIFFSKYQNITMEVKREMISESPAARRKRLLKQVSTQYICIVNLLLI